MINKPISLIGAGSGSTIVELNEYNNPAGSHMDGVSIAASDVLIQGFTFTKKSTASYGTGYNIRAGINVNPQPPNNTFFNIVLRDVISTYSQNMNVVFSGPYTYNNVVIDNCAINYAGDRNFYETPGATINGLTVTDTEFNYAGQVIPGNTAIGFNLQGNVSNLSLTGCEFSYNPGGGINLDRSVTGTNSITDCTLTSSGTNDWDRSGISVWTTGTCENLTISDCDVTNCGGRGIMLGTWGANTLNNIVVEDCSITDSGNVGFMVYEGGTGPTISNITFDNNVVSGSPEQAVLIESDGGTMSNVDVINSDIAANGNNAVYYLDYGGTFTGSNDVLNNNITNITSPYSGVRIYGLDSANIVITDNSFSGTGGYGINFSNGSGTIDAEENYWGDSSGPTHSSNPGGTGLGVSNNVDYDPWWSDYLVTLDSNSPVENMTQNTFYDTIQTAIDAANSGDLITVSAGTYTEALYINKDLTLTGAGRDVTFVNSPDVLPSYAWNGGMNNLVAIDECTADISGFTFNGLGKGNGGGTFNGVHFWKSSGSLDACRLTGFRDEPFSGAQDGNAVNVNHTWDVNIPQTVTITNNIIDDFQKTGILVNEMGSAATIIGNTVTGHGDAVEGEAAQNGIQIGYGATATISGNYLSNLRYVPESWSSAGILLVAADDVSVTGNHITGGVEIGIDIGDDAYYGYGGSNNATVTGNDFTACDIGMYVGASSSLAAFSGNTFTNTTGGNHVEADAAHLGLIDTWLGANTYTTPYVIRDAYGTITVPIIYSKGQPVIYVTAPKQLIKGSEPQTYSVKVKHVEDMRGFKVQIKMLKEDFAAPTGFAIGSVFSNPANYPEGYLFFPPVLVNDGTYWIYTVSGSYNGAHDGITGDDVDLFTFSLTSLANASALAPAGTVVDVLAGSRALLDEMNQEIVVAGTSGKLIFIDSAAPDPIVWVKCRTLEDSNNKIDLAWTNPPDAVKNHIWRLDYDLLAGANAYPTYNPASFTVPAIPAASLANGWVETVIDAAQTYVDESMTRGYYYYAVYAEDAAGNVSGNPTAGLFYRESISYWPGDVDDTPDGDVDLDDIGLLSAVWGMTPGNDVIDVGPSTDYARRSRPTPDQVIDIEDMMMFAMNYQNTDYEYYPRDIPELNPITVAMNVNSVSDLLTVTLELGENAGFVKGMDIPLNYGNGLQLQTVEIGEVWPEGSLLLHTDREGTVTASIATLGELPLVEGNGTIATITFKVVGSDTSLALEHMTARSWDNREIEIVNNPGSSTENEDLVNIIPTQNYLGHNYPNPFNPSTTIRYGLKEAGSVKVSVFNARGQLIANLVNESKAAGTYEIVWNGKDSNGRPVSSGVYFFRMDTREGTEVQKGLMIK